MLLTLIKGALGATLLLLLWVTIERAWGRTFASTAGPARESGECRGCIVCTRRCARESGEDGAGGAERDNGPGGSSCS